MPDWAWPLIVFGIAVYCLSMVLRSIESKARPHAMIDGGLNA